MRRLTKTDYGQAAILTLKVIAVLVAFCGAIIFTPLLRWTGYQDASPARAVANALMVIAIMALVTSTTELLKRWLDWDT